MMSDKEKELVEKLKERDEDLRIHRFELEMQGDELRRTALVLKGVMAEGLSELKRVIEEAKEILKNVIEKNT